MRRAWDREEESMRSKQKKETYIKRACDLYEEIMRSTWRKCKIYIKRSRDLYEESIMST